MHALSLIIHLIAVAYVGILHFVFGVHVSKYINDRIIPDYHSTERKSKTWKILFVHITLILFMHKSIAYIVAHIPFPLNGVLGHDHSLMVEGSLILSVVVMSSQNKFETRIRAVR